MTSPDPASSPEMTSQDLLRHNSDDVINSTRHQSTSSQRHHYVCETMLLEGENPVVTSSRSRTTSLSTVTSSQPLRHHSAGTSAVLPPGYMTSSISRISLASSINEIMTSFPQRHSSVTSSGGGSRRNDVINKRAIRHSFGQEWTKNHWDKIKLLEQSSSQARRCSKLSSGFAPLMIFGGLVFVCIGVSANFNSQSKDHEKLQKLSVAPLAMGSFMLMLGTVLLCTWFGCRARARGIDQKVLHGSMEFLNDKDESLLHAIFTKLYGYTNPTVTNIEDSVFTPQVIVDPSSDKNCARCSSQQNSTQQQVHEV